MAVTGEQVTTPEPEPAPAPAAPEETPPVEPSPDEGTPTPETSPQAEAETQPAPPDPFVSALMEKSGAKTQDELMTLVGQRIPDLMSQRDKAANRARELETQLHAKDDAWIGWIRQHATQGLSPKQLVSEIEKTVNKRSQDAQDRASGSREIALELVNEALESGDKPFASFLRTLASATGGKLSREKLTDYRTSFQQLTAAPTKPAATPAPAAATAAPASAAPKTPPKVPGAGSNGTPPSEPAWKGGDMSRRLLAHKNK